MRIVRTGRSRTNAVPEIICPANFGEPVFVNVYYLHWPNGLKTGAYHTGTVVYDQEYGYGGHPFPSSGIFETEPRDTEQFGDGVSFKESLYVGTTYLSRDAVQRLLISMSDEYRGDAYHLLNFNCNTFTAQFIQLRVSVPTQTESHLHHCCSNAGADASGLLVTARFFRFLWRMSLSHPLEPFLC
ncbi:hypothetical protein CRM22_004727 [Opisthorchis felineus]|uniref:PPPDE domain-containing protein n=2 Tax=Opisthorchis felineus TaxID=147828 RepID=A0A4S2M073_OPIFE|nr:hypothetical protein CRM22_004727 [Opisthorchis felineus]